MADSNLKIVVSAEDNATPALNKIKQAFEQYKSSYETIGQSTSRQKAEANALAASNSKLAASADGVVGSNRSLFTTFATATLAANAIGAAVRFSSTQYQASVDAANQYQSALSGLTSYAALFGSSAQQATAAVTSLSSDGLLPTVNSANALKNLLSSGLNLEQASGLVKVFEDRAAFGRNSTIGFGQAVENLSQAFKTEQSEAGDANGITENFSQILEVGAAQMGKNVNQLSNLERAQAKLIGIEQLSIATQGDAARYAETAAGQQAKLEYQVKQTQIAFGTALQPAIQMISQSLVDLGQSLNLSGDGMKTAQMFIATLAFAVMNAGNIIIGTVQNIIGAFQSIKTGSLKPLEEAMKGSYARIATSAVTYEQKMQEIAAGTADTRIDESKRATDHISADAAKAAANLQRQIDQENRSFADSMKQRAAQFKQSMTDMIIAHRDKSRSLQRDIADENASYNEQVLRNQRDFGLKMGELEESHFEKVDEITEQISDEKNKGLIVDGVLYAQANEKKIAELEKSLAKENDLYAYNVWKNKAAYNQEVADNQTKHDQKLAQLTTELAAETTILQTHAAEVAAVGERQKEDDISRLQRQFTEENTRSAEQHKQRLTDIVNQGSSQGAAYGNALMAAQQQAIQSQTPQIQAVATEQGKKMSDSMWDGFKNRATVFFNELPGWIDRQTGVLTGAKALGGALSEALLNSIPILGPIRAVGKSLHIPGFAAGTMSAPGGMSLVGERGPELVNLPRGSQVYSNQQSQQMSGSSSPTINIGTVINNSQADLTSLAREIGFNIALRT